MSSQLAKNGPATLPQQGGWHNTAHFEPETIYIITVGVVPSQLLGVELHQHTHARNHACIHTHIDIHCIGVVRDRLCLPKWRSWLWSPQLFSLDGLHVGYLVVSVGFTLTEAEVVVWLTNPWYVVTFKSRLWENEVVINCSHSC